VVKKGEPGKSQRGAGHRVQDNMLFCQERCRNYGQRPTLEKPSNSIMPGAGPEYHAAACRVKDGKGRVQGGKHIRFSVNLDQCPVQEIGVLGDYRTGDGCGIK
jgi:hypothetical protein